MSTLSSAELRLQLMNSIASTVVQFIQHDEANGGEQESLRAAEDVAEYVVEFLGITFKDSQAKDEAAIATMLQNLPQIDDADL